MPSVTANKLLGRIASEIRVMRWPLQRGYVLPAMTLATSAFEVAYTAAYVGSSPERARRWRDYGSAESDERTWFPWKVRLMIEEVSKALGRDGGATDNAYGHYRMLCSGKHHNPYLAQAVGAANTPELHLLTTDPQVDPRFPTTLSFLIFLLLEHLFGCLIVLEREGLLRVASPTKQQFLSYYQRALAELDSQ